MELEFNKIKKLLFLRYDGKIGDYIVTSWIYREIKKQRPDIEIDIVGISKNEKLFLNNKNVNRFYKLKKSKYINNCLCIFRKTRSTISRSCM